MKMNVEKGVEEIIERDKRLYREFLDGNIDSLNELIELYRNDLTYFIYGFVNDFHAAEDVSQEVFVYLMQHREVYKFEYTFRTYLYMIAKSRASNYKKSREKIIFIENEGAPAYSGFENVEEEIFRRADNYKLKNAVKLLKKEYQMAIYLRELQGLSYNEICLIMNKSLSQVKLLIHNARKRLKVFLEQDEEG